MDVTGWGLTTEGSAPAVLQEAQIPIVSNEDCEKNYSKIGSGVCLTKRKLCAGPEIGYEATCPGDSGGPGLLFDEDSRAYQVGIVSYGVPPCGPNGLFRIRNLPGVFTRVTEYLDWIEAIIGKF